MSQKQLCNTIPKTLRKNYTFSLPFYRTVETSRIEFFSESECSLLVRFIRVANFVGDARNTDIAAFLERRYICNDWALLLETE